MVVRRPAATATTSSRRPIEAAATARSTSSILRGTEPTFLTGSVAACPVATATRLVGHRRGLGDELLELLVEQLDLAVEVDDASRERPQRGLGCLLGLPEPSRFGARAQRR